MPSVAAGLPPTLAPPASLAAVRAAPAPRGAPLAPALAVALGLGFGALGAWALDRWLPAPGPLPRGAGPLVLLGVVPAAALAVLVHEGAHLAGGWAAGLRPRTLAVGPLVLARGGGRWRLAWDRTLAPWGGLSLAVPAPGALPGRGALAAMVAAGPLASLLGGVAALALAARLGAASDAAPTAAHAALVALCVVHGIVALAMGVATLVPSAAGGHASDGERLRRLARGGAAARRERLLAAVEGCAHAGLRPRDWPATPVRRAAALTPAHGVLATPSDATPRPGGAPPPADVARAHAWAAEHALDAGRAREGRAHLAAALAARAALPAAERCALLRRAAAVAEALDDDPAAAHALRAEADAAA